MKSMNKHTYIVDLEEQGSRSSLQFEIGSHDDLFGILKRMGGNEDLDENTRNALIVGIKSMGSAIMSNRDSAVMTGLMPHFKELMKALKTGLA